MKTLEGNEDYRAFMDKLAGTSLDQHIELPMIAVMGDTSSGKSSLLSSISGIELPSSEKLTTRCPIMLQMSHAPTRAATVEIKWKDILNDKNIPVFVTKTVTESNWHYLTPYIAEAQKYIIDATGKDVARDIVIVKVEGPMCEDLTLIDLPGIVRARGKGESATLSTDIQSLIDDYLKNKRCIILAVLPANVDFHNSQIMADAREVDPETKRTLPVLTKPDLIDKGAENSVKELLLGNQTEEFVQGFHIVKGRGQAWLNKKVSIEKGLQDEEEFFRQTQPWKDIADRSMLGTAALRQKLGKLQKELVLEVFPSIVQEMLDQEAQTKRELDAMGVVPTTLSQKRALFYDIRESIVKNFQSQVTGTNLQNADAIPSELCSAQFHKHCQRLKDSLFDANLADISGIKVGKEVIARNGNFELKGKVALIVHANAVHIDVTDFGGATEASFVRRNSINGGGRECGTVWVEPSTQQVFIARSNGYADQLAYAFRTEDIRRDPAWIKSKIIQYRPYHLPIFVNVEVFQRIVAEAIDEDWKPPCLAFVDSCLKSLNEMLSEVIQSNHKLSRYPKLRDALRRTSKQVAQDAIHKAENEVKEYIRREKVPYTQNQDVNENILERRSERIHKDLMKLCDAYRACSSVQPSLFENGIKAAIERSKRKSIDDHMAEDMEHALDAYGKVALKRFIDEVPKHCGDAMLAYPDMLNRALSQILDDDLDSLVVVCSSDMKKQQELQHKLSVLRDGLDALDDLANHT